MIARAATLALALGFAVAARPGAAQTVVLDEGSFRLSVRGTPVGTETFSIRRTGTGPGATVVAQGRTVLDTGEQTRALLQVDGPGLRPSAYQIDVTGPERQTIRGQATGNRFRATVVSATGETMREYLASEGAAVVDDGVAHHHYFLADRIGDRVPIIIPRQSRQTTARVTDGGAETIQVAGRQVQARRIEIAPQGLPSRVIWVDANGHLLRLQIQGDQFLAERIELP